MGGSLYKDEEPIHSVNLPAYYIDKYEVTNAQYKLCVDNGSCDEPISTAKYSNQIYAYHPVVYVNWYMAKVYCEKWRGARLPSEAEWEKAARGPTERIFPWDDRIITAYANYANYNSKDTKPVAYYSDLKGASFYNTFNMAGNVWEWASSLYKPYPYRENDGREDLSVSGLRVLRGGSWNSTLARDLYTFYRYKLDQTGTRDDVGFRCAKDASP